jgi:hypothetical protein
MQPGPAMIDHLQNELKPGEQLLWWGIPDPARRAKTASTVTPAYILYGTLILLAIGLIAFNIHLISEEIALLEGPDLFTIILLVISIALLLINAYRIYVTYNTTHKYVNDLRKTIYGITNQRVIVMTAGTPSFSVNSYTREEMGQIIRVETDDGWGDVSYGKPRQIQRGGRILTIVEKLVGIPNVRKVEDLLIRTFKSPQPVPGGYPPQAEAPAQSYPPMPQHYMQQLPPRE